MKYNPYRKVETLVKFEIVYKVILLVILSVIAISLLKISSILPELSIEIEGLYNILKIIGNVPG